MMMVPMGCSRTARSRTQKAQPYIHLFGNLYVVPIPLPAGATKAMIEDLFEDSVKNALVDGKPFKADKKHEDHTHYGKAIFAHKVVKPNAATIDFSQFKQLLLNIQAAIDEHRKNYPKPP